MDNETVTTNPSRRELGVRFFGSAIATGLLVSPSAAHPDAKLLALGERFKDEWVKQTAAFDALPDDYSNEEANAIMGVCSRLCDQIMTTRASTIDGLRVKAMAINWCWSGEYNPDVARTTDQRIEQEIVRDLLAI